MPDTGSNYFNARADRLHLIQPDLARELTHGICVSRLSVLVARELGFDNEHCRSLAQAALLHDIGKLLLRTYAEKNENEALTIEEIRYVRMHTDLGAKFLLSQGYDEEIAGWVYCHHENMDGSGYPRHLKGEEIPLEARIIRVCDVFAALTTDRIYRGAIEADKVIEMMITDNRYYDLEVFLAFLKVYHEAGQEETGYRAMIMEEIERILS